MREPLSTQTVRVPLIISSIFLGKEAELPEIGFFLFCKFKRGISEFFFQRVFRSSNIRSSVHSEGRFPIAVRDLKYRIASSQFFSSILLKKEDSACSKAFDLISLTSSKSFVLR